MIITWNDNYMNKNGLKWQLQNMEKIAYDFKSSIKHYKLTHI